MSSPAPDPGELLARAEAALDEAEDEDELDEAWPLVEAALAAARASGDRELLEDAWGLALSSFPEVPLARSQTEELLAQIERDLPDDEPLLAAAKGVARFHEGKFADAATSFARVATLEPENAFAAFYLGCSLERTGKPDEARAHFARAAELEPDTYVVPVALAPGDLDAVIEEALAELPPEIKDAVDTDCVIEVQDFPEERLVREGVDPLVLGLFDGPEHGDRTVDVAEGPARVLLFIRNLEKECRTREDLVDEVRVTLFHEIGHALGFDEEGVDELGLS